MVFLNILFSISCSAGQVNLDAETKKAQKIIEIYQQNQNQFKLDSLKKISKSSIRNKKLTSIENKNMAMEIQRLEKTLDSMNALLKGK
jgi:hypothetical protein